jgi:hypothetical protein
MPESMKNIGMSEQNRKFRSEQSRKFRLAAVASGQRLPFPVGRRRISASRLGLVKAAPGLCAEGKPRRVDAMQHAGWPREWQAKSLERLDLVIRRNRNFLLCRDMKNIGKTPEESDLDASDLSAERHQNCGAGGTMFLRRKSGRQFSQPFRISRAAL